MTTHGKYSASGDEPHYLMVSQSLWADGDIDLANNYQRDDGRLFGAAGLEVGEHAMASPAGGLLPSHDLGVPVTLAPVYGVARALATLPSDAILARFRMTRGLFVYSLISLSVIALVATAGDVTRRVLSARGVAPSVAAAVVVVMWLSPPLLSNSFLIFPEPFALVATALSLQVALATKRPLRAQVILLAVVLGVLPWFHRKYAAYSAALLWAALWPQRTQVAALDGRDKLLALSVYLAPQVLLAAWTWYHWGNLGGPLTMMELPPFSWEAFRNGAFGVFVDRENGLMAWSPLYAIVPAAWALAGRRYLTWLAPVAVLLLMSAAHEHWWGGFSPAGRFLVPALPIVAMIGSAALRHRVFKLTCLALLVPQAFIAADGWQHTRSFWPQGNGHNPILADLVGLVGGRETMLPSLRTEPDVLGQAALLLAVVVAVNIGLSRFSQRCSGGSSDPPARNGVQI